MNGKSDSPMSAPRANKRPKQLTLHGDTRVDEFFWLRERENAEVLAYLERENRYTELQMAHTRELQDELYNEIRGRIQQDDSTAPYQDGDYWYYSRMVDGKQYPLYCRKKGLSAQEEVILDVNELALSGVEGQSYLSVAGVRVSPDHQLLVFGKDDVGRRKYTLHFKDLRTGHLLEDSVVDATANVVWANDNRTVFYSKQDPNTLRTYQTLRHELGTDPLSDVVVYEEEDEIYSTRVGKTRSEKFL